jgi:hypothetical protein
MMQVRRLLWTLNYALPSAKRARPQPTWLGVILLVLAVAVIGILLNELTKQNWSGVQRISVALTVVDRESKASLQGARVSLIGSGAIIATGTSDNRGSIYITAPLRVAGVDTWFYGRYYPLIDNIDVETAAPGYQDQHTSLKSGKPTGFGRVLWLGSRPALKLELQLQLKESATRQTNRIDGDGSRPIQ